MRIKGTPGNILTPGSKGGVSAPGGFLGDVRQVIKEFKGLMELAKEVQGINTPAGNHTFKEPYHPEPPKQPAQPAKSSPGIAEFASMLIQAGYGDTPIGELFDQVRPLTLNQILNVIKSQGVKSAKPGK